MQGKTRTTPRTPLRSPLGGGWDGFGMWALAMRARVRASLFVCARAAFIVGLVVTGRGGGGAILASGMCSLSLFVIEVMPETQRLSFQLGCGHLKATVLCVYNAPSHKFEADRPCCLAPLLISWSWSAAYIPSLSS